MKIKLVTAILLSSIFLACSGNFNQSSSTSTSFFEGSLNQLLFGVWGEDGVTKRNGNPESVIKKFVTDLAAGKCEKALKVSIGTARESVMATIDAGCEPYSTEIISANCIVDRNMADCKCSEKRDGMEMTYKYTLRKIGKTWKVEVYEKDLDLGDMNFDSEPTEEKPKEDLNSK